MNELKELIGLGIFYESSEVFLMALLSTTMTMFAVIDIFGNLPIFLDLKQKHGPINSKKSVIIAGIILISFLFLGKYILNIVGLDLESFSIAGAILFFFFSFELILGVSLFKYSEEEGKSISIVPIAFPLLAGPGSFTMLLTLKSENTYFVVLIALIINLLLVFFVLNKIDSILKKLGPIGIGIIRRVFGIILLAVAVKIFTTNIKLVFFKSNNTTKIEQIDINKLK